MSKLEIVLGNLVGRLFFVLALLFASLPLFALTQFFGGVPGDSIIASYLVAAGAAVVVGALAISLSVSRLVGQKAVFTFYISVVSYLAITIAIDAWFRTRGYGAGINGNGVTWITAFNPFLALRSLLSPTAYPAATAGSYTGMKALILESPALAWNLGSWSLSVVLVLASTLTVRSGGLRQIAGQRSTKRPWYRKMFGLAGASEEHRAPRNVWANPIAWREAASRNATFARILARWSFIAMGAIVAIAIVVLFHVGTINLRDFQFIVRSVVFTEVFVIALVGVNMAATAISGEREDGTLDLILTTPITPGMYLAGKLRGLVSYLLPLIAIPIFTVGIAGVYSLVGGFGNANASFTHPLTSGSTVSVPAVLPEAGLLAAVVLIPFIAFCVMIGLHWSLKSKGTLGSVVGTVAVVGVVSGILGLCGWASGADMPAIGPALVTLSPASLLDATVVPVSRLDETVNNTRAGLAGARISMAIGALVSAGIYIGITYGIRSALTRNFDVTVRKLAGNA